ncbi:MAG TPA: S26 family signal peptidase [Tepidisphaeraceae bacterium]|nr:S26 family signal peptidase [Tepidisphaeraceae bacterium]
MQCPSCHFQNLPGSDSCGRCATSLLLAASDLDVNPPRARDRGGNFRRADLYIQSVFRRLNEGFQLIRGEQLDWKIPPSGFLQRIFIPGWSHLHVGQRLKGWIFLTSFAVFMVFSVLYLGTASGSIMLGIAFSIHSTAALDVLMQLAPRTSMLNRIGASFVVSGVLFGVLYFPIILLMSRVAIPREMERSSYPFNDGDVVLVNSWRSPRPGQIMLYELPSINQDITHGGRRTYLRFYGDRIDRIIAGPGQKVVWEDQTLTIDGQISRLRPMQQDVLPSHLEMTVPADHYLIFPTTTPLMDPKLPMELWEKMSLIPAQSLQGEVYFQTRPLSRIGRIK